MAESQTSVFNMALAAIGGNQFSSLNNPGEQSKEAAVCNLYYGQVRRDALESFNWGFALRLESLALREGNGTPLYPYRYALPADCLAPVRVSGDGSDSALNYLVRGDEIWCAALPAWLEYVADVTDINSMPAYFIDILVYGMAVRIALPLRNDVQVREAMLVMHHSALTEGMQKDRAKYYPRLPGDPWVQAHNS